MPIDFTAVIHPETLGNYMVLNLLPVAGASVPDVIVKVYSISPFIDSYTEEQRAALYPGQSTEVKYEFVDYASTYRYYDGVLRLDMPAGSMMSSIMVVGRDHGSTQFSNHIILGPFNTDGNGWWRHVDEDFPAPAAPSSDPVVEAVSQSGNNVSYTVGARLLYGKQVSWYAAAYRYTDAAGATTPVIFKKAFGTVYDGYTLPPNTVDVPVRLGNGTYYLRPVILNAAQEVVAMGPISTQAYTGSPSAKFLLTDAGNGSLAGSISRAEFASTDASWSAVCRYYSAESVQFYSPNGTISLPFGSSNSVAITIPALTNGASYYLRVYVNNGSAVIGESALYGPYVPNDPASYFTDPSSVDIANLSPAIFESASAAQLNQIVSSGAVSSMTDGQLRNLNVGSFNSVTNTAMIALLDRAATVSTVALGILVASMTATQVGAVSSNLSGASVEGLFSGINTVATGFVSSGALAPGSSDKDRMDKALDVLAQVVKGMTSAPMAATVSAGGKVVAVVPSATAAASNIRVKVPANAEEIYISGSAGKAVVVANAADTASSTIVFQAGGDVSIDGTVYTSSDLTQLIPVGGRLLRLAAFGSVTVDTVAPIITSVTSNTNDTATIVVNIPVNLDAVGNNVVVQYHKESDIPQALTLQTVTSNTATMTFVTPALVQGKRYTITAHFSDDTVVSQSATASLDAKITFRIRDIDEKFFTERPSLTNTGYSALITVLTRTAFPSNAIINEVPTDSSMPIVTVDGRVYSDRWYDRTLANMGTVFVSNLFPNKEYTITVEFAGYHPVTVTRNIPALAGAIPFYPPIYSASPRSHTEMSVSYSATYSVVSMSETTQLKLYAYANGNITPETSQLYDTYYNGSWLAFGRIGGLTNTNEYRFRGAFIRGDGIETEMSPLSAPAYLMVGPSANPASVTTQVTSTQVKITLPVGSHIEVVRPAAAFGDGVAFIGTGAPGTDYILSSATPGTPAHIATITKFNGVALQQGSSYKFVLSGPGYTDTVVSVTIPIPTVLAVPSGFAVTPSVGTLTVAWSPVENAESYDVNMNGGVTNYPVSGLTLTEGKYSVVIPDLTNEISYAVSVRSSSDNPLFSSSAYTTAVTATSTVTIGTASFNVTAGNDKFTVTALSATDASSYDIFYKTGETVQSRTVMTSEQEILASNFNLYEVRVRGRSAAGVGAFSDWKRVTPFSSFNAETIQSFQISTLGAAELTTIGASTVVALPPATVAAAAVASAEFATAIKEFAATQVTSLLSDSASTTAAADIKIQTDTFLRQQAAVSIATNAPVVAAPVTVADPARLGTALSTLDASAVLNVLPIPMAPPSSTNTVPIVHVPDLTGDNNALYLAGQAGDSVRIQSATDSSKFIDVTFNSSGEPVVGGVNVAGQTFINTPFGTMVRVIQGSATFTGMRQLDVVRTNRNSSGEQGVALQIMLNTPTINFKDLSLNVLCQQRVGSTITDITTIQSNISAISNTTKSISCNINEPILAVGGDYRFIVWVSAGQNDVSPSTTTTFGVYTRRIDEYRPWLSFHVRYLNPNSIRITTSIQDANVITASQTQTYFDTNRPTATPINGGTVVTSTSDQVLVWAPGQTGSPYINTYITVFNTLLPGTEYDLSFIYQGYTHIIRVKTDGAVAAAPAAICFLADAPVLTPAGYRPISSIKIGDLVCTAAGRDVAVKRVFAKEYQAIASVNPYVIPKGSFGALRALPISPNHEVMTAKGMMKAKDLGLKRMKMADSFTYYNLELEDWVRDNLVVAGVECESLAPAKRVTMTKAEFGRFVKARYGPAAAARLRTVCFEEADGSVSLPAL